MRGTQKAPLRATFKLKESRMLEAFSFNVLDVQVRSEVLGCDLSDGHATFWYSWCNLGIERANI